VGGKLKPGVLNVTRDSLGKGNMNSEGFPPRRKKLRQALFAKGRMEVPAS
jgi:hypothetical protein